MRLLLQNSVSVTQEQTLALLVNPAVAQLWDDKIRLGIIPKEVLEEAKRTGIPVDFQKHSTELKTLAGFESECVNWVYQERPHLKNRELHYFGIGPSIAFGKTCLVARANGSIVTGWDIGEEGCTRGSWVLRQWEKEGHRIIQADIEHACSPKIFQPPISGLIVCSRILEALIKPFKDDEKLLRVMKNIGSLLSNTEVLIIYPDKFLNQGTVWGDAEPLSVDELTEPASQGLGHPVVATSYHKTCPHYNHTYSALLLRAA